jgi:hypothetical protein
VDDPRPDELLRECAQAGRRHGFAFAWTDSLEGPGAKACSRSGSANWKNAKPLPTDEDAAVAFFQTRARKRNPAVALGASGLVGLEADGDLEELRTRYRIPALPATVGVRSRRGAHRYFRPPPGRKPLKVQLDPGGVVASEDGYYVFAGAIHPSGHVYRLEGADKLAELPVEIYDLLVELASRTRADTRRRFENGEPIPEGHRDVGVFWEAVDALRNGRTQQEALAHVLRVGREQCRPPLDRRSVEKQFRGAVRWVETHPTETEKARAEAERILGERRAGTDQAPPPPRPAKAGRRPLVRRPLGKVQVERVELLAGTPLPAGTSSLVAGVGGLGKSALALAYAKRVTDAGGAVLVVSYEDAAGAVIRPRFEALGGDLDRLFVLDIENGGGEISFPADLPELGRHVDETGARLVIIDPVSASIDLRLDAHRDRDVRVVLGQLGKIAERRRLSALQIAHLNKSPAADVYLRVNGSTAFYNASRLVLTVTPDPADPDWGRLVVAHKFNYGKIPDPERWRVEPLTIDSPAGPLEVMTLVFVEIADDVSREDVLASERGSKADVAVAFLRDALADGEWHDSAGLKLLAAAAKKISERTLKRAAAELEVEYESRGFPASTWWRLPQLGQHPTPDFGPTGDPA